MLIDLLDATTIWSSHIPSDGSGIGGVDPVSYGLSPVPEPKPGWAMWSEGNSAPPSGYPAVMFYPAASPTANGPAAPRTVLSSTGNAALSFEMMVGNAGLIAADTIESDLILISDGLKFNLSGQRHMASGEIDIGGWTDTTIRAGAIQANAVHKVRWQYAFNLASKTCSVVSYSCDGETWIVPDNLQNMPAAPSDWMGGAYIQFQLGSLPSGLAWALHARKIRLEWW